MDGDRPGVLQLVQHLSRIGGLLVVEGHHHFPLGGVDEDHGADIPVKDAAARGLIGSVAALPLNVVVVLGLHDPIPYPEDGLAVLQLPLALGRRIEGRLEAAVEIVGARLPLAGGGDDLDAPLGGLAVGAGKSGLAELHHGVGDLPVIAAGEKEEIVVLDAKAGHRPLVDGVGVGDNERFAGLAEDLGEAHRGEAAAVDEVAEHPPCPYRGKLVGIPDEDESRPGLDRLAEGAHEGVIHHGGLVHDDHRFLQKILLVSAEVAVTRALLEFHFQKAVDGLGLHGGGL